MAARAGPAEDLLAQAIPATPPDPSQDLVVSIIFVTAIILLVVVTGGVVYLSYLDFLDRKTEACGPLCFSSSFFSSSCRRRRSSLPFPVRS